MVTFVELQLMSFTTLVISQHHLHSAQLVHQLQFQFQLLLVEQFMVDQHTVHLLL